MVRERRLPWFLVHDPAMVAVILGWSLGRPAAVPLNVAWLVASTIWSRVGGRRDG